MSSPAAATPPPAQQMDRDTLSDGEEVPDPSRIPAEVFERDPSAEYTKDWSMMSTDSVFGLQVAPSSDFTGFFLAHPELMDISTPPRSSMVDTDVQPAPAAPDPAPVVEPPFDSIPELPDSAMKGNYSFAFPNLIEDKRNYSKKVQQEEQPPQAAATTTPPAEAAPAPVQAEAQAPASNKPAEHSEKGGLFSCFPCC